MLSAAALAAVAAAPAAAAAAELAAAGDSEPVAIWAEVSPSRSLVVLSVLLLLLHEAPAKSGTTSLGFSAAAVGAGGAEKS